MKTLRVMSNRISFNILLLVSIIALNISIFRVFDDSYLMSVIAVVISNAFLFGNETLLFLIFMQFVNGGLHRLSYPKSDKLVCLYGTQWSLCKFFHLVVSKMEYENKWLSVIDHDGIIYFTNQPTTPEEFIKAISIAGATILPTNSVIGTLDKNGFFIKQ